MLYNSVIKIIDKLDLKAFRLCKTRCSNRHYSTARKLPTLHLSIGSNYFRKPRRRLLQKKVKIVLYAIRTLTNISFSSFTLLKTPFLTCLTK